MAKVVLLEGVTSDILLSAYEKAKFQDVDDYDPTNRLKEALSAEGVKMSVLLHDVRTADSGKHIEIAFAIGIEHDRDLFRVSIPDFGLRYCYKACDPYYFFNRIFLAPDNFPGVDLFYAKCDIHQRLTDLVVFQVKHGSTEITLKSNPDSKKPSATAVQTIRQKINKGVKMLWTSFMDQDNGLPPECYPDKDYYNLEINIIATAGFIKAVYKDQSGIVQIPSNKIGLNVIEPIHLINKEASWNLLKYMEPMLERNYGRVFTSIKSEV